MERHIKNRYLNLGLCVMICLAVVGCSKDPVMPPAPNPPVNPNNYLPFLVNNSSNNYNEWVSYKAAYAMLNVYVHSFASIAAFSWTQISGPGIAKIDEPTKVPTYVRNLVDGDYVFQIRAKDSSGRSDSALIKISVVKPTDTSVVFKSFSWICPMGCTSQSVKDIYSIIPNNKPLKAFIRYADSNVWEQAIPIDQWNANTKYFWTISYSSFSMYCDRPREGVQFDLKIEY